MGPCRRSRRNPKRTAAGFLSAWQTPPLALTLRLSIARGGVNCESATVMLQEREEGRGEGEKNPQNKTNKKKKTTAHSSTAESALTHAIAPSQSHKHEHVQTHKHARTDITFTKAAPANEHSETAASG